MKEYECNTCHELKPLEDFPPDKRLKHGIKHRCRECEKKRKKFLRAEASFLRKTVNSNPKLRELIENGGNPPIESKIIGARGIVVEKSDLPIFDWIELFKRRKFPAIKIVGSRGRGKTTLMKHIWPLLHVVYDLIILFCQSLMGEAYKFLDEDDLELAFDDLVPEIFDDIHQVMGELKRPLSVMYYCDDCSDDAKIKYSRQLLKKHITGRNSNEAIITSDQSPTFLNKNSRDNLDIVVI